MRRDEVVGLRWADVDPGAGRPRIRQLIQRVHGSLRAGPARTLPDRPEGVAMVSQLLADGAGPLYRQASTEDLGDLIVEATRALTR
jgi:hypothetical protein